MGILSSDTGMLIIVAPLPWWPSSAELHRHPLDPMRSLLSALTIGGACCDSDGEGLRLSRLGRSIFMSGRLIDTCVRIYSPFDAVEVSLPIDATRSRLALKTGLSLYELAETDAIRIVHNPIKEGNVMAVDGDKDVPVVVTAAAHITEYCTHGSSYGNGTDCHVCTLLITGERGVGKTRAMRRLLECFPPFLSACAGDPPRCVERRMLSVARLLQLDAREAVETVRITLTPPPTSKNSDLSRNNRTHNTENTNSAPTTNCTNNAHKAGLPLLVVAFDGVDLLWSKPPPPLGMLVTHQLCTSLDALVGEAPHVFISTAADPSALPPPLLARLAGCGVHISPPPRAESDAPQPAVTPRAAYDGLIALDDAITSLEELAVWPLLHLPLLRARRVRCPKGAVLFGPTGCGKTALLGALAQRLRGGGTAVILVDGLSLVAKAVGRTERNIAAVFAAARAAAPSALFLDNMDSIAPPRGRDGETGAAADRALSTLLTEMDGLGGDGGNTVFVLASAPSLEALDPAVRRPGRLDVHLHLHPPSAAQLRQHTAERIAALCGGHNGSEVEEWMEGKWDVIGGNAAEANAFVREVLLHFMDVTSNGCLHEAVKNACKGN